MYSDRWSPGLRSGDIIGPLAYPVLNALFGAVVTTRSLGGSTTGEMEHLLVPVEKALITVISHDCEFNEGKRNKLLVARLQTVPGNLSEVNREDLRDSNDIEGRHRRELDVAGVNAFLLAPLPGCFEDERVIDFSTITPLPMKMTDDLVDLKRAELQHDARLLLRKKLAWFFLRSDQDIAEEKKLSLRPQTTEMRASVIRREARRHEHFKSAHHSCISWAHSWAQFEQNCSDLR